MGGMCPSGGANCCPLSRQWYVVVNLKEWAREQGVHPVTAYRWFREGKLPVPARRAGRLILVDPDPKPVPVSGMVAAYCRVSSAEQKDDLERQIGRVVAEATGRGLAVGRVVSEVGSGMNGHRPKLTELLSDPAVTVIVVENRERLTRFGFEHLAASMSAPVSVASSIGRAPGAFPPGTTGTPSQDAHPAPAPTPSSSPPHTIAYSKGNS